MKVEQQLILVRGLPGSGKSTYAQKLMRELPDASHYEADMYFTKDGTYKFNPKLLRHAHEWCFRKTEKDLKAGKTVIVSNTFTQKWEMNFYIELSERYNVQLLIKKATGTYKNIHGVPEESLEKMKARWEDIGGEESI